MKKVNKYSLPLQENSLPLRGLFCGQTASNLRPYGHSGQIICIGFALVMPPKIAFTKLMLKLLTFLSLYAHDFRLYPKPLCKTPLPHLCETFYFLLHLCCAFQFFFQLCQTYQVLPSLWPPKKYFYQSYAPDMNLSHAYAKCFNFSLLSQKSQLLPNLCQTFLLMPKLCQTFLLFFRFCQSF